MKYRFAISARLLALFTLFIHVVPSYGLPVPTTVPAINPYNVGLQNASGSVIVWKCPDCEIGMGLSVECGNIYNVGTKIDCQPCQEGYTYSDKRDRGQCKSCRKCSDNEVQIGKCTVDKDTIKCQCKVGYYKHILSKACMLCSWCCQDNSNDYKPECDVPQVPSKKHCSFQQEKQCGPTSAPTYGKINSSEATAMSTKTPSKMPSTKTSESFKPPIQEPKQKRRVNATNDPGHTYHNVHVNLSSRSLILIIALPCCVLLGSIVVPVAYKKGRQSNATSRTPFLHYRASLEKVQFLAEEPATGDQPARDARTCESEELMNTEKKSLICQKFGPKIEDMMCHDVKDEVCLMLNIKQPLSTGNYGYQEVAYKIGLRYFVVNNLSTMDDVFDVMITKSKTVEDFVDILYQIDRSYVVDKMYEMALNA